MKIVGILIVGVALAAIASTVRFVPNERAAEPISESASPPAALVIPVEGVSAGQLADSWHDARAGGARRHEALDIAAPRGTPVRAAMAGSVEKLFASRDGGLTVYVRSADRRWNAYYAHLAAYYPGIAEGVRVRAGQQIGFVGDTGNAGAGNHHLHFALHRMNPGDRWHQGTAVNPHPILARGAQPR